MMLRLFATRCFSPGWPECIIITTVLVLVRLTLPHLILFVEYTLIALFLPKKLFRISVCQRLGWHGENVQGVVVKVLGSGSRLHILFVVLQLISQLCPNYIALVLTPES